MPRRSLSSPAPRPTHTSFVDAWAALSIAVFPLTMLITSGFGVMPVRSFLYGGAATLVVLFLNFMIEGEVWMRNPVWHIRLSHPEFSARLAIVAGILLLIVETALLVLVFMDGRFDKAILEMVLTRQCRPATEGFVSICRALGL